MLWGALRPLMIAGVALFVLYVAGLVLVCDSAVNRGPHGQAIGAQSACKGRQVVSMSGDGGFTMMMGDFISLTQNVATPIQLPNSV
jgi:hypothetical protein